MATIHDIGWWYWGVTAGLLGAGLLGWPAGIWLAMALCVVQIGHVVGLTRDITAFPAQVRTAYLGLLLAGLWGPLHWIHWIQFTGTTARVLAGYCLLARILSLAPWNRRGPLTSELLQRTFLSLQTAGPPCGAVFDKFSLERVQG
ncbi:MAG: hypothetical protein OJF47_003609 [Nitrospira sp.]|nr:MAG: hypothetical protein OJF47_003609 [Nitrospira sp.]